METIEQQLRIEIERLRVQFPDTQDLYREVCTLLFFRLGITPTANKLYQLVRKGSMTAPAEALSKFWEDLRQKSRVRIEHPDLPDELKTAAGDLTATLWSKAQALANESLATFRGESQAAVLEAKAAQASAEAKHDEVLQELEANRQALGQAMQRIRSLEQNLAAESATRASVESQLIRTQDEQTRLQDALEQARREFAAEVGRARDSAKLSEERYQAAEQRAMLEIDRERTQAAKLQKELNITRAAATDAAEQQRMQASSLQNEIASLRQQIGVLEGSLQTVIASKEQIVSELELVREQLNVKISLASAARVEAENWRQQNKEAQRIIAELRAKTARRGRKRKDEAEN